MSPPFLLKPLPPTVWLQPPINTVGFSPVPKKRPAATPRSVVLAQTDLHDVRPKVETHVKNTYLKQMQAPVRVKPTLKCWIEFN